MIRCRILYAKTEPLRYTGMLDMQHIWERLFRRAGLELAYSQGFHPQPRIQQVAPLPLGFLSNFEIMDFWLDGVISIPEITAKIQDHTHPGINLQHLEEIDSAAPILQSHLQSAIYSATALTELDREQIIASIDRLQKEELILRTRRGKEYDLKPLIHSLALAASNGETQVLEMTLSAREGATGRPEEVVAALGLEPFFFRYIREKLNFDIPLFSDF